MEKFFRYLGHKAGPGIRKSKWIYNSFFADKNRALESEYLVGKELSFKVLAEYQTIKDPASMEIIENIHHRLLRCLTNNKRKFDITAIHSEEMNAFALPGGFIFITEGLFNLCKSKSAELAYIFAHEMMHVILRHPLNRILSGFSLKVLENFIRTRGAIGNLAKQAVSGFLRNGYSQENELEADCYAVRLMSYAGFDKQAAIDVLRKLKDASRERSELFNYLSSHPSIEDRITNIKDTIVTS